MADNAALSAAKNARKDEFYTQYADIEAEMNAYVEYDPDVFRGKVVFCPCDDPEWSNFTKYFASNFDRFGLKKFVSTSYAQGAANAQISLFEQESPVFDPAKHELRGRLYTIERDVDESGRIDTDDIELRGYLDGDGDFRSKEVCKLRDEADIIVTNPPFSKFRPFLKWLIDGKKSFIIIGNINVVTLKEVFPLLRDNKMWLGYSIHSGDRVFNVPDDYPLEAAGCGVDADGKKFIRVKGVRWFTNIEHGGRHEPMQLDTMAHNLKYNDALKKKLKEKYQTTIYPTFDNYDAIDVPITECIPADYDGVMGVPVTFMDKYCPEQVEILGITLGNTVDYPMTRLYENAVQHNKDGSTQGGSKVNTRAAVLLPEKPFDTVFYTASGVDGYLLSIYPRVLIKLKKGSATP